MPRPCPLCPVSQDQPANIYHENNAFLPQVHSIQRMICAPHFLFRRKEFIGYAASKSERTDGKQPVENFTRLGTYETQKWLGKPWGKNHEEAPK